MDLGHIHPLLSCTSTPIIPLPGNLPPNFNFFIVVNNPLSPVTVVLVHACGPSTRAAYHAHITKEK